MKISYDAARAVDRYLRARGHPQAWRKRLRLGVGSRGPLRVGGVYQALTRPARQCEVEVRPHRSGVASAALGWNAGVRKAI